ncbi:MAG: TonB-dependent receptor [Bacteroidales bacterium]|nr:TonB-dependent receptor [Bacteroidales bacterium]MBN2757025.1 TonB-dependent receptor [Bacteroidales bacterium]
MKILYLILLLNIFPFIALSQEDRTYNIVGIVADSIDKKGISFATIVIIRLPGKSIEKQMAVQADGKFDLLLKSTGEYALAVSSLGYKTVSENFTIKENHFFYDLGTIIINTNSIELNSINIIAEKPLVKIEADKLIYSVESDYEAKTLDGLEIMKKVPMLVVSDNKIRVNGDGNVKIYINGKPSNIVTKNPIDFLQNLPASSIKIIEVITKPGAKYDAENSGAIINILMKKKAKGYTCSINNTASFIGGLYLRNGINFTSAVGKFAWSINMFNKSIPDQLYNKSTYQENFFESDQKYTNWEGKVKHNWFYLPIIFDFSYEIDTLNLISVSLNSEYNKSKNRYDANVDIENNNNLLQNSYFYNSFYMNFEKEYFGNINYQKISKKDKRKILTLSYQIDYLPISLENEFSIDSVLNYQSTKQISKQNEIWTEHTFQIDYTFPLNNISNVETGAKYILREDQSFSHLFDYQFATNQFIENNGINDDFNYKQNILAAYLTYSLNIDKFSFKLDLRAEDSSVSSIFSFIDTLHLNHSATEFVPSSSISYQLTKSQNLGFYYTKKIKRPSVWHINPYVDKSDPNNYYSGNPNIKTEHYNKFGLNYGNFGKFGNFNLSLSYMKSNDGITREIIQQNAETVLTTFNNNIEVQKYIPSLSLMFKIGKKIRFRINSSADYNILENSIDNTNSKDWGYEISSNFDYIIIKGLKFSMSGMYYQLAKTIETNSSALYWTEFTLKKEFSQSKLIVSLFYNNAFWKYKSMNYEKFDDTYYQNTKETRQGYSFGFKVSFKFGNAEDLMKNVEKGINNDDLKGR